MTADGDKPYSLIPPAPPEARGRSLAREVTERRRLLPWMKQFAAWLVSADTPREQSGLPSTTEQVKYVERITARRVSYATLRQLRRRGDFIAYLDTLEGSVETRAKERLVNDYEFYVDAHRRAVEMALAANDHRAIAGLTGPILDRVLPKKQEITATSQKIVITMSAEQASRVHGEAMNEIVVEQPEVEDGPE